MRSASIFVCEDDARIVKLLQESLRNHGYRVKIGGTMEEAKSTLLKWDPDLILLDIILPESNEAGWSLLKWIRDRGTTPVILVSALSRADDRIRGLRAGADDFISKPFHLDEVVARVEAVLRRSQPDTAMSGLELKIDDLRKQVSIHGRTIRLSPKEYQLLKLLASSPGRVFTSDDILLELWPKDMPDEKRYADVQDVQKYVYLLRRKLEIDPKEPELVLTVRGFGYRLGV
ncbi:response regulator transcription factor [Candidatus Bipolaricaulota bacterium]|nr:response regulator transcription factor [Candidatus Bipolaricaulota bacterium]